MKERLHRQLRWTREVLLWKTDGLSEYDVRRPLTATGTNLLGLVKHVATWEARYFGEVFDRPFPEPLQPVQDYDGSDHWVTSEESREQVVAFCRRAWEHADATIAELSLDAVGHVAWWPTPETKLFHVLVHMLGDAARHAGHADILREGLDGRTGEAAEYGQPIDPAAREAYFAKVEQAARAVGTGVAS